MVVLDALHWIQAHAAPDLAVRWNCKAAKCGSCSAEVNGRPRLTCKTRLSDFELGRADHGRADAGLPAHPGSRHRRVVELRGQQDDPAVHPAGRRPAGGLALAAAGHRAGPGVPQVHRVLPVPGRLPRAAQPRDRAAVHGAALSSSGPPASRCTRSTRPIGRAYLKDGGGIGYCNITKCCTEVCPEHIKITDNAIIPLKERVADEYYDPIRMVWRKLRGGAGHRQLRPSVDPSSPTSLQGDAGRSPDPAPDSNAGAGGDGWTDATSSGPMARPAATRDRHRLGAVLIDLARPDARDPRAGPTPRSPTTSASRRTTSPSTRASSARWSSPASSARPRSTCSSTRSSSSSSSPAAGGSRTRSCIPLWAAARRSSRASRAGRRRTCRAPRTRVADALANEAIDRARGRRAGLVSSCVLRTVDGRPRPATGRGLATRSADPLGRRRRQPRVVRGRHRRQESSSSALVPIPIA